MTKFLDQVTAYYFPTTIILVDDNKAYLENIENILDRKTAIYKSYDNPVDVYNYLLLNHKHHHLSEQCVEQKIDPERFTREIKVNLQPIQQEVYNPKRFEYITVVVADHDMPEMQGLELFKKIKDLPVKKILLTGAATTRQALDAFNEGVIDQFISKDADNFNVYLNETLQKLSLEQLKSDSRVIINSLIFERRGYPPSCLNAPAFMKLLDSIIKEHHICEYYLIDENGSYVFLDANANLSWLIVKNEDDLNSDIMLAQDSDEPPSTEIIQQLKDHKLILSLLFEHYKDIPAKDWMAKGLLHPMKKFAGPTQDYYYAYIDANVAVHALDRNKIISFHQYQENLPAL